MKKMILIILATISVIANIATVIYLVNNKMSTGKTTLSEGNQSLKHNHTKNNTIDDTTYYDYRKYYFITNPADEYFCSIILKKPIEQMDYRSYQVIYCKYWKFQYDKIMEIINKKCIYKEDKDIFKKYKREVQHCYDVMEPAVLAVAEDNFSMPESPEKHSGGNGTFSMLEMYEGMLYRDVCIQFIPLLEGQYKFPSLDEINNFKNNTYNSGD